jgi:hypothetical protein
MPILKKRTTLSKIKSDDSPYFGESNELGEKEGKGKIVWKDESEYDGQWKAN